jgi:hypothetical protein
MSMFTNKRGGFKTLAVAILAITSLCCLSAFAATPPAPAAPAKAAAPATPARKQGFDAFRLVRTRNIFDPKRNADSVLQSEVAQVVRRQSPPPAAGVEYAALTGILITNEKTVAFFSGSRPEYNKVLPVKAVIAGATISKITPGSIEVQRDGKPIAIAIGETVPLDGSAPAPAPYNQAPPPATAGSNPAPSSDTSPGSSDRDSVLRRMMERRQKELK